LDKNEIAAMLESLCERPFAGDPGEQPLAVEANARRAAQAPSRADEARSGSTVGQAELHQTENLGQVGAELASILSGTATDAQRHGFQEAAVASDAVRLEAQSALAFVEGIEQAPLTAPAHLVEQVLAPAGSAPLDSKPSIWSRLSGSRLGGRRGQVVSACAVMLMAGGLSWSLLWRPADLAPDGAAIPAASNPKEALPIDGPQPGPASVLVPLASAPAPTPPPTPALAPPPTRDLTILVPAPASAPAQALADPCAPRSFSALEGEARPKVESKAGKPAPNQQSKIAAASAPDPGCVVNGGAIEAGRSPPADQARVRAERPAAKTSRSDRDPAAAAASAPAARPASPAVRPGPIEQRR
jgi:hypothetical protein